MVTEKLKSFAAEQKRTIDPGYAQLSDDANDKQKTGRDTAFIGNDAVIIDIIARGNIEKLRLLINSGWQVDSIMDCKQCTPLMVAIGHAQNGISEYLLDQGASLLRTGCARQNTDVIPGHLACRRPENLTTLQKILRRPQCPQELLRADICNTRLETFLHEAPRYDNVAALSCLLEHDACPSPRNINFITPLHYAASCGSLGATRALVEAGAQVNAYDNMLNGPADFVILKCYEPIAPVYRHAMIEFRSDAPASWQAKLKLYLEAESA